MDEYKLYVCTMFLFINKNARQDWCVSRIICRKHIHVELYMYEKQNHL